MSRECLCSTTRLKLRSALAVLNRRMDVMESRQRGLVQSAHKMREGFKGWYDQYSAAQVSLPCHTVLKRSRNGKTMQSLGHIINSRTWRGPNPK